MPVEQRIRLCMLLEKMYAQKEFSEKLGLEDKTVFHGEKIQERGNVYVSDQKLF